MPNFSFTTSEKHSSSEVVKHFDPDRPFSQQAF